ncbi:unnamed protein product [Adineta steineri]|uniref:guanylate cyclase n=1 Tax=Adineta steineri TaxID=433720 RepID=A0A819LWQ9_9BILA|nr:unnamed protein product [Adineta steineri]CAF3968321.1 unnamed protein product [Adineta steineri]
MLYGIILDSARDFIILTYGLNTWRRVVHDLKLPSETFDLFTHYSENIILHISDCLADILHEGTRDTYLEYFGQDFFRYFNNFGYHKLFRIAARNFRDFLFVIDQLHDSNRFTFPQMRSPIFHVTEEDDTGITLEYKSVRQGFTHYAMGSLLGAAKTLFKETNIRLYIRNDLSTSDYTHIVLWIQFDNRTYQSPNLRNSSCLPHITGLTFFKVFPFSILMDSSINIRYMGGNIRKVFPTTTVIIGRPLNEVFRLIRPDIHVEWDKILSYGQHIVFLMENRLPLRSGPSGRIRLKGQMKYIENKNMLWFLCHPVLGSANDMVSAGLHLTDLNLFDGTSELLVTRMHQTREMENIVEKEKLCAAQLEYVRTQFLQYRKQNHNLLCTIMPKHIASMIQSGIPTFSLCESYPLVTIMFVSIMDLKISTAYLKPTQIIEILDQTINVFDDITEKYDVLKVKTKSDPSYMFAAGLHERSNISPNDFRLLMSFALPINDEEKTEKNLLGLNSTEIIAYLSFELLRANKDLINPMTRKPFGIKIGFHTGAAIGGIIGDQNLQYCLFGDSVTIARQIMTTGETDRIHISQTAYRNLVTNNRFAIEYRGQFDIKDRNMSGTYWLTGINKNASTTGINTTKKLLRCPYSGSLL